MQRKDVLLIMNGGLSLRALKRKAFWFALLPAAALICFLLWEILCSRAAFPFFERHGADLPCRVYSVGENLDPGRYLIIPDNGYCHAELADAQKKDCFVTLRGGEVSRFSVLLSDGQTLRIIKGNLLSDTYAKRESCFFIGTV